MTWCTHMYCLGSLSMHCNDTPWEWRVKQIVHSPPINKINKNGSGLISTTKELFTGLMKHHSWCFNRHPRSQRFDRSLPHMSTFTTFCKSKINLWNWICLQIWFCDEPQMCSFTFSKEVCTNSGVTTMESSSYACISNFPKEILRMKITDAKL